MRDRARHLSRAVGPDESACASRIAPYLPVNSRQARRGDETILTRGAYAFSEEAERCCDGATKAEALVRRKQRVTRFIV